MGVNSAVKGFFNHRWLLGSGLAMGLLVIFFIASSFTHRPDRELLAKQVNLMIRQIGDRLLRQAGDSTSRVLPVTEIKEGTFLLAFENELGFNHDSLMMLTLASLPKTQFPAGYTVTVHECLKSRIVYGFQLNNTLPDILACRGRKEPIGCYTIEIAFLDLYENAEQNKADVALPAAERKSVKIDPQVASPKVEEVKSLKVDPQEANAQLEELKSFKVDPQEANPKLEEFKTTANEYPSVKLVLSGILALSGIALFIGLFGKILIPATVQKQVLGMTKESGHESAALGKFQFNVNDQRLLLGSEAISLTDKECRILELLNKDFGELIPRETLMQKVWIDEGVITGRSLDMFVSKLRKKLRSDPALRITNVHGKGYKLEMPGVPLQHTL